SPSYSILRNRIMNNTGNPIGSVSPLDREDNSIIFDKLMLADVAEVPDRLGRPTKTVRGMNAEFEGKIVDFASQVNDIVIAGGRIFDDEAQGRAAVQDDQYFYAASPDPNVSKTLWKRIDSANSRFVADDPSALYLSRVLAGASTGPKIWNYPYSEFHLTGFERLTLDQNQNILAYQLGGETISLRNSEMRSTSYPLTLYLDADGSDAAVDARGNVVNLMTVRDYFGRPCPYPYTDYSSLSAYLIVDKNDLVVDVKTLTPPPSPDSETGSFGAMYVEAEAATNTIRAAWLYGADHVLRVTYQPNGKNNLFNWRQTEIASGQDLKNAVWTIVQSSSSDCWPPFVVEALENGDGASAIYTGGNHGSDGSSGGENTAVMDSCHIYVDGRRVMPGEELRGYAHEARVEWVNRVMAYNTLAEARYVLEQRLQMSIRPGDASGFAEVVALEPIDVLTDNGPQMFSIGYDSIHFYDGIAKARMSIADADGVDSGPSGEYPAWAATLKSAVYGIHGTWMDREFEAGDGRYVNVNAGFWRRGGGSNTKVYAAAVKGHAVLTAGESYQWHGGYFWYPIEFSDELDSAFVFHKRNRPNLGWSTLDADQGKIQLPTWARGSEINGLGVAGVSGVKFQSDGYSTRFNKVEL
ncbi:hypothetical protein ACDI10_09825, partial [Vreelandella venusta]|uniref:hypothetical protein n=1 Tax=Vreelandella venusta TaxID=44935 RepID=UPI003557D0AF